MTDEITVKSEPARLVPAKSFVRAEKEGYEVQIDDERAYIRDCYGSFVFVDYDILKAAVDEYDKVKDTKVDQNE